MHKEKSKIAFAITVSGIMVILMIALFYLESVGMLHIKKYGLKPKSFQGLLGVFTMPFLHGSWAHVLNNSASFLVLCFSLFYFYREIAWKTLGFIAVLGGFWLWISGGPNTNHIGASGVIYGLAAFLFTSGLIRKNKNLMALSAIVTFLYGSFFWGILPIQPNIQMNISWQGHLWGAVAGLAMALYFRKEGPQRKVYQYEIDEMLEVEMEKRRQEMESRGEDIKVIYHIKKSDSSQSSSDE